MSIGSTEFRSLEEILKTATEGPTDLKQCKFYVAQYSSNMFLNLGEDYKELELKEDALLVKVIINEKTLETILITSSEMRIYQYNNKEVFKTDIRILKSKVGIE